MKFCQFVASLHAHVHTSYGRFTLIFGVNFSRSTNRFLPFQVSSFSKSDCLDLIASDE